MEPSSRTLTQGPQRAQPPLHQVCGGTPPDAGFQGKREGGGSRRPCSLSPLLEDGRPNRPTEERVPVRKWGDLHREAAEPSLQPVENVINYLLFRLLMEETGVPHGCCALLACSAVRCGSQNQLSRIASRTRVNMGNNYRPRRVYKNLPGPPRSTKLCSGDTPGEESSFHDSPSISILCAMCSVLRCTQCVSSGGKDHGTRA